MSNFPRHAEGSKARVLFVDTLSATNDFGVEMPVALDPLVELTVFTIKGTRLKESDCARILPAFPEYWGSRSKFAKIVDEISALWKLSIELLRHRNGVVHIQFFRFPLVEVPVYLFFRPVLRRLVFTAHNALPHENKHWHHFAYKLWYSIVDQVHVLSNHTGEQLTKSLGVSSSKIGYAPHGNYDRFIRDTPPECSEMTRRALGISENEKLILYFGLIRPYKGVDRLIDASPHISTPNTRILVAGGCAEPLLTELRQRILTKDTHGKVTFLPGFVENKQLSSLLAAADLVVFPYTHIYQSGAVLLAMSFGKPVLVSDIEGFREYVHDSQTGWLVDTSDATLFANSIDSALQNSDALTKIGRAARYACDTDFSWSHIAQTIVQKLYLSKP